MPSPRSSSSCISAKALFSTHTGEAVARPSKATGQLTPEQQSFGRLCKVAGLDLRQLQALLEKNDQATTAEIVLEINKLWEKLRSKQQQRQLKPELGIQRLLSSRATRG